MNAIYKFVLGMIGKRSGVVTTLPSKKQVEFQANMLAEKFMQNGIDPNALKSPEQVKNVLANIDQANMRVIPADSSEGRGITKALGIGKKADVMDMKGNKINTSKGIMGGEEIKPIDELQNYTKSKEDIVQDLVDQKFGKGYFDTVDESNADMIIKNIKSMEPIDAMKEASSVIGRKGKYKNLTEEQSKKILKDTEDHIFERDIPEDPEDFAIGGRVGLKGGAFLNFMKNLGKGMNNKSPLQAYKDYLKSVKERTLKANETGKFTDLPLETIPVAASGGLLTSYLKKKMKAMDEEQKAKVDKKADGGRIGLKGGADAATESFSKSAGSSRKGKSDPKGGFNLSGGQGPTFGGAPPTTGGGGDNNNNNNNPPPVQTNNKPPIQTTSDDSVNRGFLSDVRKKNQRKYLGILKKYKPDDFDALYNLDPTAITEEDSKFLKSYGVGTVYKDLSKTNIENFFDIFPKGVPPKKDPTSYSGDYKYNFAKLNDMGRIQLRNLEKKKGMVPHGGDPFTDKDQQMLDELQRRDADPDKTYGPVFAADGGRIGYKAGSVDKMRRLILKAMGAGTAGIAGAKSGIFSFGKGPAKEVAKEVAQQTTTSTPPPYFFKLAEKIKMLGDDATATTDRTIAKTLKSKDGKSTYLLEEDVATGDTIIKKINKEGDEMITDVEIMELKKGEVVMGKDGKPIKVPDEYEEVTEANARIEGDVFNDPYYTDGIQVDDIIKEVDDKVPSIKYASGGLAYMLGE